MAKTKVAPTPRRRSTASAEPFRQILTSSSQNTNIPDIVVTSRRITPRSPVPWSITKTTLHGGKQEGCELIVLDNGKLQITIIPTRGMGILSVRMGDLRLGWDSPVKEVVHPKFINLQSRGGLGWLEGFNEWLVRCGLENNGAPGTDRFINNVGDEAAMELTLHGRIANLPAREVEILVDRQPPYRIRVRGWVDERMVFGPKLELRTEISTEPGSDTFRITDLITNDGAQDQEFELLYHINFGRPLLEEGSRLVAPLRCVTPINNHAAKAIDRYCHYSGPETNFIEQVYCMHPLADQDGKTVVMLQNKAKDRAVSLSYLVKELPYLTLWKNTAAEKDGYVTGIEPGTNFPHNRQTERKAGRVPKLAPGASYATTIDFALHAGAPQVQRAADQIAQIQDQQQTIVDARPETV